LRLAAISVVSEDDVWAVGSTVKTSGTNPFALHWDGHHWRRSLLPGMGNRGYKRLAAVDAIASDDVWAVGTAPHSWAGAPLALHFDGTSWTRVSHRVFKGLAGSLTAVADNGPTDVWLTGLTNDGDTLAVHWDGRRLTRVDTEDPPSGTRSFHGVCMPDSGGAVAVGSHLGPAGERPLAEQWDGTRWSIEETGLVGKHTGAFLASSCSAADDLWAVGWADVTGATALVAHRTAQGWSDVPSAEQPKVVLDGVVAVSPDDVWAVGYRSTHAGTKVLPWVEHGTGEDWTGSTVPYSYIGAKITGVDADAPDDVWVTGNDGVDGVVFIDRWDGSSWTRMR